MENRSPLVSLALILIFFFGSIYLIDIVWGGNRKQEGKNEASECFSISDFEKITTLQDKINDNFDRRLVNLRKLLDK